MDFNTVIHIARISCRLVFRSWLFRFFLIFSCVGIFIFQLIFQGNETRYNISGLITMASFIPYMNLYIYTILQAFVVIFLAGNYFTRERGLDTMETVHYRSVSNWELVLGYYLGFLVSFGVGALFSLFLGLCVHLFFSAAPFSLWAYLFYFLTLFIPSMIFYTGFSFFMFSVFREQTIGLVILFFCFFLNLYFTREGIMDSLGISLPNALSGQVGHPELSYYLFQRSCWFLIGSFFLVLAIKCFYRLPNGLRVSVRTVFLLFLLLGGICCGFVCYKEEYDENKTREFYRDIYTQYREKDYLALVNQDIELYHAGATISCKSRLFVENRLGRELDEIVFFLNPALKISSLKVQGEEMSFRREGQVVIVNKRVSSAGKMKIEIVYAGGIDDRICYLDVPDISYQDTRTCSYLTCRFGKRNAFLGKDYTLLLPECLWYPVTVPPVNPVSPFDVSRQFTIFNLTISGHGKQKVISQGEKSVYRDRVVFKNRNPVTGLSLCMGDYIGRMINVDGIRYELYMFKNSLDVFRGLNHVEEFLSETIRESKGTLEEMMGRPFPYSRFQIVETPLSFTSYYREWQGGSGYVQPEIVFLPERGVGYCMDMRQEKKGGKVKRMTISACYIPLIADRYSDKVKEQFIIKQLIEGLFLKKYHWKTLLTGYMEFNPFTLGWEEKKGEHLEQKLNNYYLSPMFYEQVFQVKSTDFPVLDHVFLGVMKSESARVAKEDYYRQKLLEGKAINYLKNHSMANAGDDSSLSDEVYEKILSLKTDDLFRHFTFYGIQPKELYAFVDSCTRGLYFQEMNFENISRKLEITRGVDCKAILSGWYNQKSIPVYVLKKFRVEKIDECAEDIEFDQFLKLSGLLASEPNKTGKYRVVLELYNDSEVDGIVSLVEQKNTGLFSRAYYSSDNIYYRNIKINAGTGKVLTLLCKQIPVLDLGISKNYPRQIKSDFSHQLTGEVKESVYLKEKAYFLQRGGSSEIIVDNEDAGFYIPKKRELWFRDLFGKEEKNINDIYDYEPVADGKEGWRVYVNENAYGSPVRSAVYKLVGEGKSVVSWNTEILTDGNYEIYIYSPVGGISKTIKVQRDPYALAKLKYMQYYTVKSGVNVYSAELNVRERTLDSWFLLGQFYLEKGKLSIELSDKGSEIDQIIQGDAVKIVYVSK